MCCTASTYLKQRKDRESVCKQSEWILLKKLGSTNETFTQSTYIIKIYALKIIYFPVCCYQQVGECLKSLLDGIFLKACL